MAGPLAGLAGMALGASGGSTTKFVCAIGFSNGDAIMIGANAKEYMEIKSMINLEPPKPQIKATGAASKKSTKKRATRKSSKFAIIDGRAKASAPEPNGKLFEELNKLFNNLPNDADEREFFTVAKQYTKALNDFKWRYFDQLLSEDEAVKCFQIAVTHAHYQQNSWKQKAEAHQKFVDDVLESSIKMYEEESKKFFGSAIGSKSELEESLKDSKATKARYLEYFIPEAKQSVLIWTERISVFEKLGARLIGEKAVDQGKKTYLGLDVLKSDGSLLLNFGKRFFKETQTAAANTNPENEPPVETKDDSFDIETRLKKLTTLFEKKLITEAEFNNKRKSILDDLGRIMKAQYSYELDLQPDDEP